jgi:hypothetical protein
LVARALNDSVSPFLPGPIPMSLPEPTPLPGSLPKPTPLPVSLPKPTSLDNNDQLRVENQKISEDTEKAKARHNAVFKNEINATQRSVNKFFQSEQALKNKKQNILTDIEI